MVYYHFIISSNIVNLIIKKIIIILLLSIVLSPCYAHLKFIEEYPFKIGEKIVLSVKVLGIYLGDQTISLEKEMEYKSNRVVVGYGALVGSDFISRFYKINDVEQTYFIPENFIPVYYEKKYREGSWTNRIEYFFDPVSNRIEYYDESKGNQKLIIESTNTIRNYFTLISCMRSIDYDYYITNNIPIVIDYLTVEFIKRAVFIPKYGKYRYNGKQVKVIYLEEQGGVEMTAIIMDDEQRTPLQLIIPALKVIGFKTINVYVELKEYIPGDKIIKIK